MNLYSIIQSTPDERGDLSSYSILITFVDKDKAHELFDKMKQQNGMEPYRNGSIIHRPTGVAFYIMYHNAI